MSILTRVVRRVCRHISYQWHKHLVAETSFGFKAIHFTLALALILPNLAAFLQPPRIIHLSDLSASSITLEGQTDVDHSGNTSFTPPKPHFPDIPRPRPRMGTRPNLAEEVSLPPLMFIENVGQFDGQVVYQLNSGLGTFYLTRNDIWISLLEPENEEIRTSLLEPKTPAPRKQVNLRLSFVGANEKPEIIASQPLDTKISYFFGNDPDLWAANVPVWAEIRYKNLYSDLDLIIDGKSGVWEWRFEGTGNLEDVALKVEGGELELSSPTGEVTINNEITPLHLPLISLPEDQKPVHNPEANNSIITQPFLNASKDGRPAQLNSGATTPLNLYYSTYLGGSGRDEGWAVAVGSDGSAYVTGFTESADFITVTGSYDVSHNGLWDVFVTKLAPDGKSPPEYSTYIGGDGNDIAYGIAVNDTGEAFITGAAVFTDTIPYPTTAGAYDTTEDADGDAFVTHLSASGDALVYSTFLGGEMGEEGLDIAINDLDHVYVTGSTTSEGPTNPFPTTTGAFTTTHGGGTFDGFFSIIYDNDAGSDLLYSTFYGGSGTECYAGGTHARHCSIALHSNGDVYITGNTASSDFPVTSNAIDGDYYGFSYDAYLIILSPDGNGNADRVYGTYLGGNDHECRDGCGVAVDAAGIAYLAGETASTTGITPTIIIGSDLGVKDIFIAKIDPTKSSSEGTLYLLRMGGENLDVLTDIEILFNNHLVATGYSHSGNFPTTQFGDRTCASCPTTQDAVYFELNPNGYLTYGTFIGGISADIGRIVLQGPDNSVYLTGYTNSSNFPTTADTYDHGGGYDAYAIRFQEVEVPEEIIGDGGRNSECPGNTIVQTQGWLAGPINTRTGGVSFTAVDLSVPTPSGELSFQREYSSFATGIYTNVYTSTVYTKTLGYGWTHNHAAQLTFSNTITGSLVLAKVHSANQYQFYSTGDGSFEAYPGVCASLTEETNGEFTLTDKSQNSYTFDDGGKLLSFENPQGLVLTYTYEITSTGGITVERLTQAKDMESGRYLTFFYDDANNFPERLEKVADYTGREVTFEYDLTYGNLVTVTVDYDEDLSMDWVYTYTEVISYTGQPHFLGTVYDPLAHIIERNEYDAQGRALRQYNGPDSGDKIIELTYNEDGTTQVVTFIDWAPFTQTHTYDRRNTLVSSTDEFTKTYDADFNPSQLVDPNNNATTMGWSAAGNLTVLFDAEGNRTDLTYDDLNNLTSLIDPRDFLTEYVYSGTLLTMITDTLEFTTSYGYTSEGYLETVTDSLGNITEYTFDSNGQIITVMDADERVSEYGYDNLGRQITVTLPGTSRIDWTCYDGAGRVVKTIQNASGADSCDDAYTPSGEVDEDVITEMVYDGAGNLIATIAPDGLVTRTFYDDSNRPEVVLLNFTGTITSTTIPVYSASSPEANIPATTRYDVAGNVIAIQRAYVDGTTVVTRTTRTYFDALGRPEYVVQNLTGQSYKTTTPPTPGTGDENLTTQTYYDAAGNVTATKDPLGRVTRTWYDDVNRPILVVQNYTGSDFTSSTLPSCSASDTEEDICSWTYYDESRNVIASKDHLGTVTRTWYDALNRPITVVHNIDESYIYTTTLPKTDICGAGDENVCNFTVYDGNGNVIATVGPMGTTTRTFYDRLNRPITVVHNLTGQAISVETAPDCNDPLDDPDENVCTITHYDDQGRAFATTDPLGRVTRIYFDALNRPYLVVRNFSGNLASQAEPTCNQGDEDEDLCTRTYYDVSGKVLATEGPLGTITRTWYDVLNRPITVVQNIDESYIYTTTLPTCAASDTEDDENLCSQTYYDALGRAIATEDHLGTVRRTYYDGVGRPETVVANLASQSYTVATPPDRVENPDPDEDLRSDRLYDAGGQVLAVTDPMSITTRTWYDGLGRATSVVANYIGAMGAASPPARGAADENLRTDYAYNGVGNRTAMTDALGVATGYAYDGVYRLAKVTENQTGGGADAETNVETVYTYDASGNRLTIVNGRGYTTTFTYDDLNRLLKETDPRAKTTAHNYDMVGNRTVMTDALGNATQYVYDDLNRLVKIDYPTPDPDVTIAYNALSLRTVMTDVVGTTVTTTWDYDALGRPITVTDTFSGVVGYAYDGLGRRTGLTYPGGKDVSYTYDAVGRLTAAAPGGESGAWTTAAVTQTYNANGWMLTESKPNGVETTYAYDDLGRVISITHFSDYETFSNFEYVYDAMGNRKVVTESVQTPTNDLIFADGFESGDTTAWDNVLDGGGLLTVTTDAAITGTFGLQATISGTQQLHVRDDTPDGESHYRARFYFEPSGLTMANGDMFGIEYAGEAGTAAFLKLLIGRQNNLYRIKMGVQEDGGAWQDTSWYTLSANYHHIEFEWRQSTGNNNGYLKFWIDDTLKETVSGIDDDGREVDKIKLGALSGIDPGTSGTFYIDAFESRRHTYIGPIPGLAAPENNRVARVAEETDDSREFNQRVYLDYVPPTPLPDADFFAFFPAFPTRGEKSINESGGIQTTEVEVTRGGPPRSSGLTLEPTAVITYTYDSLNRLIAADYDDNTYFHYVYDEVGNRTVMTGTSGVTTTYEYDIANRLTKVGGTTYTWDDNGNLLDDGTNTYGYDHANRLITTTQNTTDEYSFVYNGLGDRLQQTKNGVTTTFTLDLVSGLTQVLADGTDTYLYGVSRSGEFDGSWSYFHGDALGSVRQMSADTDYLILEKTYKPFGDNLSSSGSGTTNYGFTGEWQLEKFNLIHLRARYYAPGVGRFISRDTWGGVVNQPISFNKWLYGYSNPVNLTDPSGRHPGNHSPYCEPLRGADRNICEKIIRGISLNSPISNAEMKILDLCDYYGDSCSSQCEHLRDRITLLSDDHPPIPPPSPQYGYWYHHLLNIVPGWWNQNGTNHVDFLTVLSTGFGLELSTLGDEIGRESLAEAMGRKSWGEGFYRMIGGRQAVQTRVEEGLFGYDVRPGEEELFGGTVFYDIFGWDLNQGALGPGSIPHGLARRILYSGEWDRVLDNRPYEWANLVASSTREFKIWINIDAPMLAAGQQGEGGDPTRAIWYALDRGRDLNPPDPLKLDTLYILTKEQDDLLETYFPGGPGLR